MNEEETKIEYLESCLKSADWNVKQNQALLKEAWKRLDYLEGREAELMGKLFDALHQSKGEAWSTEDILRHEG